MVRGAMRNAHRQDREHRAEEVIIAPPTKGPLLIARTYTAVVLGDLGVGKTNLIKMAKQNCHSSRHFSYPGRVTRDHIDYLTNVGIVRLETTEWNGALARRHCWKITEPGMFPARPDIVIMVFNMCNRRSWNNVFLHKDEFEAFLGRDPNTEKDSIPFIVVGTHSHEKYKAVDERLIRPVMQQKVPVIRVDNPSGEGCDRPFTLAINLFAKRDRFILAKPNVAAWPCVPCDSDLVAKYGEGSRWLHGQNDVLPDDRCVWPYDNVNSRWFAAKPIDITKP